MPQQGCHSFLSVFLPINHHIHFICETSNGFVDILYHNIWQLDIFHKISFYLLFYDSNDKSSVSILPLCWIVVVAFGQLDSSPSKPVFSFSSFLSCFCQSALPIVAILLLLFLFCDPSLLLCSSVPSWIPGSLLVF